MSIYVIFNKNIWALYTSIAHLFKAQVTIYLEKLLHFQEIKFISKFSTTNLALLYSLVMQMKLD